MSDKKEVVNLFFQNVEVFHDLFPKVQKFLNSENGLSLAQQVMLNEFLTSIKYLLDVLIQDFFVKNSYLLDKSLFKDVKK